MSNMFAAFRRLLPSSPLLAGVVTATDAAGCTIELPDGGILRARGQATIGAHVFVRDGVIEGAAPALSVAEIEV